MGSKWSATISVPATLPPTAPSTIISAANKALGTPRYWASYSWAKARLIRSSPGIVRQSGSRCQAMRGRAVTANSSTLRCEWSAKAMFAKSTTRCGPDGRRRLNASPVITASSA